MAEPVRLSEDQMGRRVARELEDGWLVNVGIGMPTSTLPHVPPGRDVIFHSENGIIGIGPIVTDPALIDPDLLSPGKQPVVLMPGGCYVHHADSFAIIRGGHLDATILGAFQVAENGDMANWKLPGQRAGSVGGAMDIASSTPRVFIMMTHTTRDGEPKIVKKLTYPLTAQRAVTKIFTDMAVISVTRDGLVLEEVAPGLTVEQVQAVTEPRLLIDEPVQVMEF